jgi:hypothetical protein
MKIMRLKFLMFLMATGVAFSFVGCGSDDDEDTEKPVISIDLPTENASFVRGVGEIIISGKLTANQALDTCVVSLITNLKNGLVLKGIDDPVPFTPDPKGYSLSGKSYEFSDNESPFGKIWDNAKEGAYTLHIEVTDEAGNKNTKDVAITITAE